MVVKINLDQDRLSKLTAELAAIELWDSAYHRATHHDKTEDDSHLARQKRREEIFNEIME
jgi:transcriptional regulator with XRE-family HTH domain